jgi:uncharacterized protein
MNAPFSFLGPTEPATPRRWTFRRLARGVAMVFGAGLIGLNVLAYRHAHAMMHFGGGGPRPRKPETMTWKQKLRVLACGVEIPRPRSNLAPAALGPGGRSLRLGGTNGVTLGAWYCAASAARPLVILFHGYTGEKTQMLLEAKALLGMGFPVLLVDFRGSGESSESYTTIGYAEAEDVTTAVEFARDQLGHARVVLYGESMGAVAILRAVHSQAVRPEAIIVEGVFDRMLRTVRHRFEIAGVPSFPAADLLVLWGGFQAGFNGFRHNPVDYAGSVSCPILFLHGTADPRARLEEAREVFAAVPGAKQFHEFAGAGHEAGVVRFRGEWTEIVGQFLQAGGSGLRP